MANINEAFPNEMFQHIFRMVHVPRSYDVEDARDRIRLGLVCRRWRSIAISDTALWLDVNDCIGNDETFKTTVSRSGKRPLSVRVTGAYGFLEEIQDLLGEAVGRLERLEVLSAEHKTWRWMPLFRSPLPSLRSLLIHTTHPRVLDGPPILRFDPKKFFDTCSSLQSLFLINVSWNLSEFNLPPTLRTLSVEFMKPPSMTCPFPTTFAPSESDFWVDEPVDNRVPHVLAILGWLAGLQYLENISLSGIFSDFWPEGVLDWDTRQNVVEVPALRVLHVRGALTGMKGFLFGVHTPNLVELALFPPVFNQHLDILLSAPPRLLCDGAYLIVTLSIGVIDTSNAPYGPAEVQIHVRRVPDTEQETLLSIVDQTPGSATSCRTFFNSSVMSIKELVVSQETVGHVSPMDVVHWQEIGEAQADIEELCIPFMLTWAETLGIALAESAKAEQPLWPNLRVVNFGRVIADNSDEVRVFCVWLEALHARLRRGSGCTVIIMGRILTIRTIRLVAEGLPTQCMILLDKLAQYTI